MTTDAPDADRGASVTLRVAEADDAPAMLRVIHAAFAARPPVDPPAAALSDTVDDIVDALRGGHGVIAEVNGEVGGCLLLTNPVLDDQGTPDRPAQRIAGVHRVSVLPELRQHGLASALVHGAADLALDLGATHVELLSRREFPQTKQWWTKHGFVEHREVPLGWMMRAALPTRVDVPDADAMQRLGEWLATIVSSGDVIVLNGDLGAGKTTLTQGLGRGLVVDGPIISPTFVLSRVHAASVADRPGLVHVDAYRLGSAAEVEDLDLEESLADHVTVIEWGRGVAETLSPDRLEIDIRRGLDGGDDGREVLLLGLGERWQGVRLSPSPGEADASPTPDVTSAGSPTADFAEEDR